MSHRDKATNQLEDFRRRQAVPARLTTGSGAPVGDKLNSVTVGPRGPVLLQDTVYIDEIAHFDRHGLAWTWSNRQPEWASI